MDNLADRSLGVSMTTNLENLSEMIKYKVPFYSKLSSVSEIHGDDRISYSNGLTLFDFVHQVPYVYQE